MSDIIDEIAEEQRQEKIANFLVKYLFQIIFVFIAIMLAVFMYSWNKSKLNKKHQNIELSYSKALSKDLKELPNIKLLEQVINNKTLNGYQQLAYLEKASSYIKDNKLENAEEAYNNLAKSSAAEYSIKYLAELISASILIKSKRIDSINYNFEKLTDKKNPFYVSAMLGKIELLSVEKKYSEAYEAAKIISSESFSHPSINKKIQKLIKVFKNKK